MHQRCSPFHKAHLLCWPVVPVFCLLNLPYLLSRQPARVNLWFLLWYLATATHNCPRAARLLGRDWWQTWFSTVKQQQSTVASVAKSQNSRYLRMWQTFWQGKLSWQHHVIILLLCISRWRACYLETARWNSFPVVVVECFYRWAEFTDSWFCSGCGFDSEHGLFPFQWNRTKYAWSLCGISAALSIV